ncbi:MAG: hypothetical protein BGO10_06270 [Chlamydia sp. 32-24]|nr:MAG: hypothetical protein BGO10_06270 [Chlamydia sp. 32-24]
MEPSFPLKCKYLDPSCQTIADAQVIVIGEKHYQYTQYISDYINQHFSNNAVVLVEAQPAKEKVDKEHSIQAYLINDSMNVYGWDIGTASKIFQLALPYDRDTYDVIYAKEEDQFLKAQAQEKIQERGLVLNQNLEHTQKRIETTFLQRNESMQQSIEWAISTWPEKKIIVITGKSHIKQSKQKKDNPNFDTNSLTNYLKSKKLAIIHTTKLLPEIKGNPVPETVDLANFNIEFPNPNCQQFEQTNLVVMTEGVLETPNIIAKFINQFAQSILLISARPAQASVEKSRSLYAHKIDESITVLGWDIGTVEDMIKDLLNEHSNSLPKYLSTLNPEATVMPNFKDEGTAFYNTAEEAANYTIEEVQEQNIKAGFYICYADRINNMILEQQPLREKSLIETANWALDKWEDKKIFVIVGESFVKEDTEVRHYLSTKQSAVLVCKASIDHEAQIRAKLAKFTTND